MRPDRPAGRARGFTLLEVLVAVALTAVAGVMAYGFLNTAIDAHGQHAERTERLDEISLFLSMFSRDMMHAIDRPVVNEFGEPENALVGGIQAAYLLSVTRTGWPNPREMPRSELQRVAYGLNDGAIERVVWPTLDRVDDAQIIKSLALQDVENLEFRFLRWDDVRVDDDEIAREWQASWPVDTQQPGQNNLPGLPAAVELRMELQGWGEIRRLFALGGKSST